MLGKILEARMRAQLGEANERLRERQNYIGNTKKQLRILVSVEFSIYGPPPIN